MFDSARTPARTLLIAAATAGFVALGSGLASADTLDRVTAPGSTDKIVNPGTVNKVVNPGTVNKVADRVNAPDVSAPEVEVPEAGAPEVAVPEIEAPEVTAPDANGAADSAQELVDGVDETLPQVNVPEPSTDKYVAAARGVTYPVLYSVIVARGDVEAVSSEAVSVAGQVLDGVDADLEAVDTLPEADDLVEVPDAADVERVTDLAELPDAADVDTEALPEAPAVEDVEDIVGGAVDQTDLDSVTDLDAVDTELVGTDVPADDLTGDLADGLL